MLVRKLENFRATLSDIFMGKSIGFPSQNEHFRHFHLGILSQDWKVRSRSIDTANFLACNVLTVNLPPFCTVARKSDLQQSHVGRRFDLHGKTRVASLL